MLQDLAFPPEPRADAPRWPGLRFEVVQATRPTVERPAHGVPLFVGFGVPKRVFARRAPAALEVSSWEHFEACVGVTEGSFLGAAVKGFFANGGTLCAILPVVAGERGGAAALEAAFARDGAAEDVTGIDLVCVPDAVSSLAGPASALAGVQAAVLAHCEHMGERFALLDVRPSPGGPDVDGLRAQANRLRTGDVAPRHVEPDEDNQDHAHTSLYGALYGPWLHVDVESAAGLRARALASAVPPCGHVAGVYARTDARAGVVKAPANEVLEGAFATEWELSDAEHGALNDAGVNCIRSAQGRGMRVWGARTLSGRSDWLYVPVVRVFLALTRWLEQGLDDIVFESNTPELWQRVERRIGAYCMDLFSAGSLAGSDTSRAFFVKCDAELNPPDHRDAGRLVAAVGLALAVPAEFVVVRIVHDASGIVLTPA